MGVVLSTGLLACLMMLSLARPALPADRYEDSLKQVVESLTSEAVKAKHRRLALVDFTDSQGAVTPAGRFLAEEIGTQLLVAGERQVVEPRLARTTLKKFGVGRVEPSQRRALRRAAKAMRADGVVTGSYLMDADAVVLTMRLVNPVTGQAIGAVRGSLPKAGPLSRFFAEAAKPAPVAMQQETAALAPAALGAHRNEQYELLVQNLERTPRGAKLDLLIENRSSRDIKILCLLQGTRLTDERGQAWPQAIEDNREGLCTRGLELSPRANARAVLTFTAPADGDASELTLHYVEKAPRRDAVFAIERLRFEPHRTGMSTP